MMNVSRRQILGGAAGALSAGMLTALPFPGLAAVERRLAVTTRVLDVRGKTAKVFSLGTAEGHGLILDPGERFTTRVTNDTGETTLVHWHGQTPPSDQDGVPVLSQEPLAPGGSASYDFVPRQGTHWMHSHVGLQEQQMLAAPLIVRSREERREDRQEVVVMLHDFTFRDPEEILAELTGNSGLHSGMSRDGEMKEDGSKASSMAGGKGQDSVKHGGKMKPMGSMDMPMVHLNDVDHEAFLANDRTLDDPEVIRVERGGRVRLRLINGASSTNFWVDLGALRGSLVAVDGNPVRPVTGNRFPIGIAQRMDILVDLPAAEGAWPVLSTREGDVQQTGIILATAKGPVSRIGDKAKVASVAFTSDFERGLVSAEPLGNRPVDRTVKIALTEGTTPFSWGIDGRTWDDHRPIEAKLGERVEIVMNNPTNMSHPMHLHGVHFQVVDVNGRRFAGAVRDTVLVPPRESVTIAFDADNPGRWAFHCHNVYHMAVGMMTEVRYGV